MDLLGWTICLESIKVGNRETSQKSEPYYNKHLELRLTCVNSSNVRRAIRSDAAKLAPVMSFVKPRLAED